LHPKRTGQVPGPDARISDSNRQHRCIRQGNAGNQMTNDRHRLQTVLFSLEIADLTVCAFGEHPIFAIRKYDHDVTDKYVSYQVTLLYRCECKRTVTSLDYYKERAGICAFGEHSGVYFNHFLHGR
jgi:hypothetical protein